MRFLAFIAVCVLLGLPAPAHAQIESARSFEQWNLRLKALDPERPIAYFELGEEIADSATTVDERSLARELFGLAGLLDRQALGQSAALAIADLEERPAARQRLRAAANLLADSSQVDRESTRGLETSREGRLAFCRSLAALRRGDAARATRHLGKADARVVMEELAYVLPGGSARFQRDLKVYSGGLRPDLGKEELESHLVAESIALAPKQVNWSVMLRATGGAPLLVIDLERLDRLFGADPTRPYWREGRWVDRRSVATNGG